MLPLSIIYYQILNIQITNAPTTRKVKKLFERRNDSTYSAQEIFDYVLICLPLYLF